MNFRLKLSQEALFPRNKIKKKMQFHLEIKIVSKALGFQKTFTFSMSWLLPHPDYIV